MEEQNGVVPAKNNFFTRRVAWIAGIVILVVAIGIGYYFISNSNSHNGAASGTSGQPINTQGAGNNTNNTPGQNQQSQQQPSGSSANSANNQTVSPAAASSGAVVYENIPHNLGGVASIDSWFQNSFQFGQSNTVLPAYYLVPTETDLATEAAGNYYTKAVYQLGDLTLSMADGGISADVNDAFIGSAGFGTLGNDFSPSAAVATLRNNNAQYFTITGSGCDAGGCSTNITLAKLSSDGIFSGNTLYKISNSSGLEFNSIKGAYSDGTYTYVIFGSSGSNANIAFALDATGNLASTITGGPGQEASSSPTISIPPLLQSMLQSSNI